MRNIRRLAQFDLNLLVIFRLLDETRHVTKAAKILGITQPTFSHALKRLRAEFDNPLFLKSSGGMVLTPIAESLSTPIRQILDLLECDLIDRGTFNLKTLIATPFPIRTFALPISAPNFKVGQVWHERNNLDLAH